MLYYRLAYTLHSFSREPRNIAISYLKIAPRIVKMFVNIKYIMCVLLLLVCTSTPSSWISTRLLCPPKHCEEHKSAMATHFCTLVLFDCAFQGRNQLVFSGGGHNDVTSCCAIQIHTFVKTSGGGQLPDCPLWLRPWCLWYRPRVRDKIK